jgi:hypothetical protein
MVSNSGGILLISLWQSARYLVQSIVVEHRSVREVARRHGVSKTWLYELVARYKEGGEAALELWSRRPRSSPNRRGRQSRDRRESPRRGPHPRMRGLAHGSTKRFPPQFRHPERAGTVTVPGNLASELKPGTLASVWKEAGITGWRRR